MNNVAKSIDEGNFLSCYFLAKNGYNGSALQVEIKKSKLSTNVTVPITNDRIKLIAEAKSHGQLFPATGGSHLTSDNFFKAMEVPVWAKKVKQFEDDNKRRLQLEKNKIKGKEVLAMNKPTEQLNATDLEKLLLWHNVPKKELGNKREKLKKINRNTKFKPTATVVLTMGLCRWRSTWKT